MAVVEFFGPSGSGKSTLVAQLHKQFEGSHRHKANGYHRLHYADPLGPWQRRSRRLSSVALRPVTARRMLPVLESRAPLPLATDLCFRFCFRDRLEECGPLCLLDEGPLHRIFTFASKKQVQEPTSLLRLAPLPDAAVYLSVSAGTSQARLTERAAQKGTATKPSWPRRHKRYDRAARRWLETTDLPHLIVNADAHPDPAGTVAAWLTDSLVAKHAG